jgi:hypothetical protein
VAGFTRGYREREGERGGKGFKRQYRLPAYTNFDKGCHSAMYDKKNGCSLDSFFFLPSYSIVNLDMQGCGRFFSLNL